MPDYQLEIKQVVDHPRCRIYREFVQTLIADRSIRTNGGSGLFYYTVLCSYANFRTSYRRLDGITYTVYPGEWVCRVNELTACFRVRFQHKALSILKALQDRQLITFTQLGHGRLVKYSIKGWRKHNTVLDYNCPCQKESGFFFMPIAVATELISYGKASEMDVVLDLWLSAIYKDSQVLSSEVGPVVYLRNGTGNPLLNYSDLAQRWGLSRSTVGRLLKKLADLDYLTLMSFPGRTGSVIYLNSYLSTMFQVSDVMVDKDEVAMSLYLAGADLGGTDIEHQARCIERSHKMLTLAQNAVDLLRTRHKNGEAYYWLLHYTYLSPQQLKNVEEIIEQLRPHIHDISFRTYYRRRKEAIEALSSVLWGYTAQDSLQVLEQFFPAEAGGR